MKYLLLIVSALWTLSVFAQRPDFNELKKAISEAETREAKVRAMTRYGDALPNRQFQEVQILADSITSMITDTADQEFLLASSEFLQGVSLFKGRKLPEAKPFLKSSAAKYRKMDEEMEFRALNILGLTYIYIEERDSAIYLFQDIIKRIPSTNKKGIISAHGNLGLAYRQAADFGKAIYHFEKVYELDSTDAFTSVNVAMNIARMYIDIKLYDKAIETLKKADISRLPNIPPKAVYFNNIADAYQQKNELDSAKAYFQKAHDTAESIPFEQSQFINAGNLVEVSIQQENFSKVPELLDEMERIKKISRVRHAEIRLQLLRASYLLTQSKADSALLALQIAEAATQNPQLSNYRLDVYSKYVDVYNQLDDQVNAKRYLDKLEEERKSPSNSRHERFLADAKASYLLAVKEGELAQSQATIEVFSSQRILLASLVLLSLGIAFVLFKNYKKSSETLADQQAKNEDLTKEVEKQKTQILELKSKALLEIQEIICIKSDGHYLEFSLKSKERPEVDRNQLKNILEMLPDYFVQIHRSYIINLKEVRVKYSDKIQMKNGQELPVSRSYKAKLNDTMNQFND